MGVKKYLSFKGRAKRKEYWIVQILIPAAFMAIMLPLLFLGPFSINLNYKILNYTAAFAFVMFPISLSLLLALFSYATAARRCRDIGISPWWVLLILIPMIGLITWITLGCIKSEEIKKV